MNSRTRSANSGRVPYLSQPRTQSVAAVGAALCLAPMIAQSEETQNGEIVQTVVVTGSRIRSETPSSTGPVTVLDNQQLTRGGNDSLGKVLQTLPYNTGSPTNTNVNNGGDGSTRVDLRGLKPLRTLVLLNGRRLPNGGLGADSSVDIDTLPLSMVDHVEVLTTGASAVYGADAIGGVVNVITRSGFSGLEVGAQHSATERGDGAITRAQALVGGDLGGSHWMLGVDYVRQDGVLQSARDYSAVPMTIDSDGSLIFTGSPTIPEGVFRVPAVNALGLSPGNYTHVPGSSSNLASDWRRYVPPGDNFNYAPYNYLQTPNERTSLWMTGTWPIADDMELFFEGHVNRRESTQTLAPSPYMLTSDSAPLSPADGRPYIPADNYYNPFGADIVNNARRRLVELGERGYDQRVDMWRALGGVRGNVGRWSWEVSMAAADSDAVTHDLGVALAERFIDGVGSSGPDVLGSIVCGTRDPSTGVVPPSAVIAGCVPINLFGGPGTITQEQIDYLSASVSDHGVNSQRLASVSFTGPWGNTPAGDILWAFGAEFRRESGAYRYDPLRINGSVGAGLGTQVPGGEFEAREGYVEGRIPLLRDGGWGDLTASLGGRLSDFDSFGSHTTWHAGLRWELSGSWALRADYTTLFRAPAISELYLAQSVTDDQQFDPCGNSPSAEQQVNCAANGVPGGEYVQAEDDVFFAYSGGNPALDPEQGHSFDAGVEFRSHGALNWQASLDYFRTELDGYIESVFTSTILDECADRGTAAACNKIRRLADGSIRDIDVRLSNFGSLGVDGLDFHGAITFAMASGEIRVNGLVSKILSHDAQVFEGSETFQNAGQAQFGVIIPKWRALAGVRWSQGDWSAGYNLQWIGDYEEHTHTFDDDPYSRQVPSVTYHDVDASYEWRNILIRAGVNNLTDKDPPYLNQEANTSAATYRLLGRTYFLQLSYSIE